MNSFWWKEKYSRWQKKLAYQPSLKWVEGWQMETCKHMQTFSVKDRYFAYEVHYVSSSICLTDWLQNCSKLQNYIYTYTYNIVGFFGIVNRCHFWWGNPIQTGIWQLPWQYSFTLCQAMLWCHKNIILSRTKPDWIAGRHDSSSRAGRTSCYWTGAYYVKYS